jgi:hypothetical protein
MLKNKHNGMTTLKFIAAYCSSRGHVGFIFTGHDCPHQPLERAVRSWSLGRP